MPRLFPRWSDTAFRLALIGLVIAGTTAIAGPMIFMRTPYNTGQHYSVDQPVQFDHRHHVKDDGIDCRYCHRDVERSAWAGVPSTDVCMGCHNQVWRDSPMLEPVRRAWFSGQPIPWNRVHQLPQFVYFDHSVHVNHGIGCVSCHSRVDGMALTEQGQPLTMGWCLSCHRSPERNLRPLDKITDLNWQPPSDPAYGKQLANQYGTRKLDHCTACHR